VLLIRYYQLKRASEEEQLKARQQLEMQEKMATLGQLSAGIAHEIKNPLNFVNNFAVGSSIIVEEIEEWMDGFTEKPDSEQLKYLEELVADLKQNAVDIHRNGQRIDRIVNSMMEHARDGNGERQMIDINSLIRENLNLAYLGYRALKPSFKATLEEHYDPGLKQLEGVSQDIGRVLLNIFNNACYAMHQKQETSGTEHISVLKVETKIEESKAVILIRDNGVGVLPENKEKIFTPFFTTKPTGEGNAGLGLSISYDIIVQGHQGTIDVNSEPGAFTEFIIRLPLSQNDIEKENTEVVAS
jgi:signal transduction histidine kinase